MGKGVVTPRSRAARITLGAADRFRQPHRRRVARPSEGLAQGDRAAIHAVVVDRSPAIHRDRAVLDDAVGRPARTQRRQIDEQLERRARLAPGLGHAVERGVLVALAADHRDHSPVGGIATSAACASPIAARLTARTASRWRSRSSVVRTFTSPKSASNACARKERPSRRNRCRSALWTLGDGPRERGRARARRRWRRCRPWPQHQLRALLRELLDCGSGPAAMAPGPCPQASPTGPASDFPDRGRNNGARPRAAHRRRRRNRRSTDSARDFVLGQPGLEPEGDDHLLRLAFDASVGR